MNIYEFDIWDGNKGIIFAETEEKAYEIFKRTYPDIPVCDKDVGYYDSGVCSIDYVGKYGEYDMYIF